MMSFQSLKGAYKNDREQAFTRACSDRTWRGWLLSKRQ